MIQNVMKHVSIMKEGQNSRKKVLARRVVCLGTCKNFQKIKILKNFKLVLKVMKDISIIKNGRKSRKKFFARQVVCKGICKNLQKINFYNGKSEKTRRGTIILQFKNPQRANTYRLENHFSLRSVFRG